MSVSNPSITMLGRTSVWDGFTRPVHISPVLMAFCVTEQTSKLLRSVYEAICHRMALCQRAGLHTATPYGLRDFVTQVSFDAERVKWERTPY